MFTSKELVEGEVYTRKGLQQQFHTQDATINNGVFKLPGYCSVWLFVTEQKTIDRVQFQDYLDGDILQWDGQPEGRTDKLIIEHEANGLELLVFYRRRKNEFLPGYGFRYEGRFHYKNHIGSRPTQFTLQRVDVISMIVNKDMQAQLAEESPSGEIYKEGKAISVLTNKHERNTKLRAASIRIHGTRCQGCGFSFAETYGALGEGFIEVHHLHPVSQYNGETSISPSDDMAVVCPNCHRMIHRNPEKPLSIEELRQLIAKTRSNGRIV